MPRRTEHATARVAFAALCAVLLAALIAAPAAAAAAAAAPGPRSAHPTVAAEGSCPVGTCRSWSTFATTDVRGAFLAERLPDGMARVSILTDIAFPGVDAVRGIGSSVPCGTEVTPATRIISFGFQNVTFEYFTARVALQHPMGGLKSFRLYRQGTDDELACAKSIMVIAVSHESGIASTPSGAEGSYSRITQPFADGLVLEVLSKTQPKARLSIALHFGVVESIGTKYTLFGSRKACGTAHTAADTIFRQTVTSEGAGAFGSGLIETQDPGGIQSVRIVKGQTLGGEQVACQKGFDITVTGMDVWTE